MGWLYMKSLHGHSGPREYLDAQFAFERPDGYRKCYGPSSSASASITPPWNRPLSPGEREVLALICLVAYNPRDREGYIFGYKDSAPLRRR